jgi:hypothetical protein
MYSVIKDVKNIVEQNTKLEQQTKKDVKLAKEQQINTINKSNINNTNINDKTNDAELYSMDDDEIMF